MRKFLSVLFLLFFCVSISYSDDLSQILGTIRIFLSDNQSNTAQNRHSSTVYKVWINNAQKQIVSDTRCISSTTYTATVSGTQGYDIPSNFICEHRISYSTGTSATAYKKIEKVQLAQKDLDDGDWESLANGQPIEYYLKDRKIYLVPAPNASWAGTNRLKIEFFRFPADLSADGDIPYDGLSDLYPYHNLIVYSVLAQAFTELKDTNATAYWEAKYSNLLGILLNNLAFKPDWQPSGQKK